MGSFFGKSSPTTTTLVSTPNCETFSLLWLHTSINEFKQIEKELRSTINHIQSFKQCDQCEQYIRSVPENRIVLITNGEFGRELVPRIHDLLQISSIYIYCTDCQEHQQWTQQIPKVKAISNNLDQLIIRIKTDRKKKQKIDEPLSINILTMNTSDQRSSTDISGDFLHNQLFMEALLRMTPSSTDMRELIDLCNQAYKENSSELTLLATFQSTYSNEQALKWYTQETFLYRILNQALRTQNVELLFLFRFFIRDIQEQLQCLHAEQAEQSSIPVQTYRSQLMSIEELSNLILSIGNLISVNSFFSTSPDSERALFVLDSCPSEEYLVRVLFEIDADPRLSGAKPFADISEKSHIPEEKEILFSFGSIFRLTDITPQDGIYFVKLVLCSDVDDDFKVLLQHKQQQLNNFGTPLLALGLVLISAGKFRQAESFYRRLLRELHDDQQIMLCYKALEKLTDLQGKEDESATLQKKIQDIKEQLPPKTPLQTSKEYISLADQQRHKEAYTEALHSYNQALLICEKHHSEEHCMIAQCLNDISKTYMEMNQYNEALEFCQKAMCRLQKSPTENRPALADYHDDISYIYVNLKRFDYALDHAEQSLNIRRELSSTNPQPIALSYRTLAFINMNIGNFREALRYLREAATLFRLCLSPTHPIFLMNEEEINDVESYLRNNGGLDDDILGGP